MATHKRRSANVQRIGLAVLCVIAAVLAVGLILSLAANVREVARNESLSKENVGLQSSLASQASRINELEMLAGITTLPPIGTTPTTTLPTTTPTTTQPTTPPTVNVDVPFNPPTDVVVKNDGLKLVALTFDDGPGPYTNRLLDELKARNLKATFFWVGNRVANYATVVKRVADEGHEIASHSYEHGPLHRMDVDTLFNDLKRTQDIIEQYTGVRPRLMRPPGGNYNQTVQQVCSQMDLRLVNWSVDTRDWESRNAQAVYDRAFSGEPNGISDGSIVLMHDIYSSTVDGAIMIMDRLIAEGYTCVTVSELLEARRGGGTPGRMYTYIGQ